MTKHRRALREEKIHRKDGHFFEDQQKINANDKQQSPSRNEMYLESK